MSVDDFDCDDDFRSDSFRRARIQHICYACRETIRPGDRYHHYVCKSDGGFTTTAHCLRCWAICKALWQNGAEAIDMSLNCGHTWEEAEHSDGKPPPPEVARLAFLTRDEAQKELACPT